MISLRSNSHLLGGIINISIKCNDIIPITDIMIIIDFIDDHNDNDIENFRNTDNEKDSDDVFVD